MTTEVINPPVQDESKKAGRGKLEKKDRAPRTNTLQALLWEEFAKNSSYDVILRKVADKFPKSKYNEHPVMHFNYYRAKFNIEAKAQGRTLTTSSGAPKPERKPRAVKAEGETAVKQASKGVKDVKDVKGSK